MGKKVQRQPRAAIGILRPIRRLHQRADITDYRHFSLTPELMKTRQTGMKPKSAANARDSNLQQTRLRQCNSGGLPRISVTCIIIVRHDRVAAVITAKEKNAHESLVIVRLGERLQQTETLEGQCGRAECSKRPT